MYRTLQVRLHLQQQTILPRQVPVGAGTERCPDTEDDLSPVLSRTLSAVAYGLHTQRSHRRGHYGSDNLLSALPECL